MYPEHRLSAPLQLHLYSLLNTWFQWIRQRQLQDDTRNIQDVKLGATYIGGLGVFFYSSWSIQYVTVTTLPLAVDEEYFFNGSNGLPTSLGHCLFNGSDTTRIVRDMIYVNDHTL